MTKIKPALGGLWRDHRSMREVAETESLRGMAKIDKASGLRLLELARRERQSNPHLGSFSEDIPDASA